MFLIILCGHEIFQAYRIHRKLHNKQVIPPPSGRNVVIDIIKLQLWLRHILYPFLSRGRYYLNFYLSYICMFIHMQHVVWIDITDISEYLFLFCTFYRLYLLGKFQLHSKMEREGQRFLTCPLPPYMKSLLVCQHPLSEWSVYLL